MGKTSTSQRSPLSPTLWPANAFDWRLSAVFAIVLVATILVAALGIFGLYRVLHVSVGTRTHPSEWAFIASGFAEIPVVVLILTTLPRIARRTIGELGLHQIRFRNLAIALVGALAMLVATSLAGGIEQTLFHLKVHENVITIFNKSEPRGWLIAFAILAAIYAPFVEELVFRGFVFNAILRYTPVWLAIAASSAIFAGAHFEDPTSFFPLAMAGVVLATVYYRTGSLVTSILTHGTFNFISLSLYLISKHG